MTPQQKRFMEEKSVSIWSDWSSTGIWSEHGVCVPVDWLPISGYANCLIHAMQLIYDWQDSFKTMPYGQDHVEAYEGMRQKAREQVKIELPDWSVR